MVLLHQNLATDRHNLGSNKDDLQDSISTDRLFFMCGYAAFTLQFFTQSKKDSIVLLANHLCCKQT